MKNSAGSARWAFAIACLAGIIIAGSVRAAEPSSTQPTTAATQHVWDVSTPLGLAKLFIAAMCDGDVEGAKTLTTDWGKRDAVLKSFSTNLNGRVLIDEALSAKFGAPPARKPREPSAQALREFARLETAPLDVQGATAWIRVEPAPLVLHRVNGRWLIDPKSIYADVPPQALEDVQIEDLALGATAKEIALDIQRGVYKSAEEANKAMVARMEATLKEQMDRIHAKHPNR